MSKLYSNYLKRDFELSLIEKQEGDRVLQIVPHDALEDIIHNQIPLEQGVTYDYRVESTDPNHSVVICIVADQFGRRVVGIGEATPGTLDNEIAKTYPTLIASQRAFDRAVIRYLAFPGKAFSNTEIPLNDSENSLAGAPVPSGIQSTPVEEPEPENSPKAAPIQKQEEKAPTASDQAKTRPGDVMMKAGKLKFKATVAQAFTQDISSIAWVMKNIKPTKLEYSETLEAISSYIAENAEAKAAYEKYIEENPQYKTAA